jgi:hypothetical protein
MEASGALGQGAADGGQADGGQRAENGQAAGQDFGQLMDTLSQLSEGQEQVRQLLASQPWQPEQEPGQEQTPTFEYGDPNDPAWDEQAEQERLAQYVKGLSRSEAEQLVAPFQEQIREMRMEREADKLTDEFPELAVPEVAEEVVKTARMLAEANGDPEMANKPWVWRLVYMAGRAAEAANEEGAETPEAARLEGGGGALPAAQLPTLVDQILNPGPDEDGGLGGRVLNFG